MDKKEQRNLLEIVSRVYNSRGMTGFQKWVGEYQGSREELFYLKEIEEYLEERNGSGDTRVFGFDSILIEEILSFNLQASS